jgi:hypothetical protein
MKKYAIAGASLGMAIVTALGAANASHAADRSGDRKCTKSTYSAGGKHYGKVHCTGGSATRQHKAMATCRTSDDRSWVAEGQYYYQGHTSTVTCGTAKVTFVTWVERNRG